MSERSLVRHPPCLHWLSPDRDHEDYNEDGDLGDDDDDDDDDDGDLGDVSENNFFSSALGSCHQPIEVPRNGRVIPVRGSRESAYRYRTMSSASVNFFLLQVCLQSWLPAGW